MIRRPGVLKRNLGGDLSTYEAAGLSSKGVCIASRS